MHTICWGSGHGPQNFIKSQDGILGYFSVLLLIEQLFEVYYINITSYSQILYG